MSIPTYTTSVITSVAHAQQSLATSQFLMGGKGGVSGTDYAMFSKSSTYSFNIWRSQLFTVGVPFNIVAFKFSLSQSVGTNMQITPVIGFDDGTTIIEGTVVNTTNYPEGDDVIILTTDNFGFQTHGLNNFYVEFQFSGSALLSVLLPIDIELETEAIL